MDLSEDNIVLVLAKDEESSNKEWENFKVGLKSAQPTVSPLPPHKAIFFYDAELIISYKYGCRLTGILSLAFVYFTSWPSTERW